MVEDDTRAELLKILRQLESQIEIADRLQQSHLAAILCDAQSCVEKILAK